MAIEWLDGFDHHHTTDPGLDTMSLRYLYVGNIQGEYAPGRYSGLGLRLYNTGFGQISFLKDFGGFNGLAWGFDLKFDKQGANFGNSWFFSIRDGGSNAMCGLAIRTDGRVQFVTGGDGYQTVLNDTELDIFTALPDTWYNIQVSANFPIGLKIQWQEGTVWHAINLPVYSTTSAGSFGQYVSLCWKALGTIGVTFDNYWIASHIGIDRNDIFTRKRTRIYTYLPTRDIVMDGTPKTGFTGYPMVFDNGAVVAPDGDVTYVDLTTGQLALGYNPIQPIGSVQAVAHNVTARVLASGSYKAYVKRSSYSYKTPQVLAPTYRTYQNLWQDDPDTGSAWRLINLQDAEFGAEYIGGTFRNTQHALELLVLDVFRPNLYKAF